MAAQLARIADTAMACGVRATPHSLGGECFRAFINLPAPVAVVVTPRRHYANRRRCFSSIQENKGLRTFYCSILLLKFYSNLYLIIIIFEVCAYGTVTIFL